LIDTLMTIESVADLRDLRPLLMPAS
jgi:hypothetical protein